MADSVLSAIGGEIELIYQPTNASPSNVAVDVSKPFDFQWQFNGDSLTKFDISVYELNSSNITWQTSKTITGNIYGGDIVSYTYNASALSNGKDYIWKITQYENNPSIYVLSGRILEATSGTNLKIGIGITQNLQGMYMFVNGQYSEISSYSPENGSIVLKTSLNPKPIENTAYSIYSNYTTTLNGFYIKARSNPSLSINDLSSESLDDNGNLKYRSATFYGKYSQDQNISIKYHRWTLYNLDNEEILSQTDNIYNSNLSYTFDGFNTGSKYKIRLDVTSQEEQYIYDEYEFSVLYDTSTIANKTNIYFNKENNSVRINLGDIILSKPVTSDDCKYQIIDKNYLQILQGNIRYNTVGKNPLNLDDFTFISRFYLSVDKLGTILALTCENDDADLSGDCHYLSIDDVSGQRGIYQHIKYSGIDRKTKLLSIYGTKLNCLQDTTEIQQTSTYVWNNEMKFNTISGLQHFLYNENSILDGVYFTCVITPSKFYFFGTNGTKITLNVTRDQIYKEIVLYDNVFYDYILLLNYTLSEYEIMDYLQSEVIPNWTIFPDTQIFAPYTTSIISADIEGITSDILGYAIYRRESNDSVLHFVSQVDISETYIEDFLVCNNKAYSWVIIPVTETEFGTPMFTKELFISFDEWTVTDMQLVKDKEYKVTEVWKFGLNIEAEKLEQNILKTKFDTLSKYPKFSIQGRNYISGGLSAYLTNITVNTIYNNPTIQEFFPEYNPYRNSKYIYYEPSDLLNQWNDLVARGHDVVIRDLKGHIYRAQIDSNEAKIDHYNYIAPTTISFTFVEVDSVDDISLYIKE